VLVATFCDLSQSHPATPTVIAAADINSIRLMISSLGFGTSTHADREVSLRGVPEARYRE